MGVLLVWVLAILFAGAVALLSVPVELWFDVERNGSRESSLQSAGSEAKQVWTSRLTVRWMFGLVKVPVAGGPRKKRRKPKRERIPKKKRRAFPAAKLRVMLQADFLQRVARWLGQTLRAIRWGEFRLRLRIGFDDPAETGYLWAVVGPVTALLPQRTLEALDLEPDFWEARFDLAARGRIRIFPAEVIGAALAFLLSPVTLRTLWQVVRA